MPCRSTALAALCKVCVQVEAEYRGSEEETRDLLRYYSRFQGDMHQAGHQRTLAALSRVLCPRWIVSMITDQLLFLSRACTSLDLKAAVSVYYGA